MVRRSTSQPPEEHFSMWFSFHFESICRPAKTAFCIPNLSFPSLSAQVISRINVLDQSLQSINHFIYFNIALNLFMQIDRGKQGNLFLFLRDTTGLID